MRKTTIVLDLDDTIFRELDYLKSAYFEIAKTLSPHNVNELYLLMMGLYFNSEDVFLFLEKVFFVDKTELINIYRNHMPNIQTKKGVSSFFGKNLGRVNFALITDGRSITQRNKLKSLKVLDFFDFIVISEELGSEKPSIKNFKIVEDNFLNSDCMYIADNPNKDFLTPNRLGWDSICLLDDGFNVHPQSFELPSEFLPKNVFSSWYEIIKYVDLIFPE